MSQIGDHVNAESIAQQLIKSGESVKGRLSGKTPDLAADVEGDLELSEKEKAAPITVAAEKVIAEKTAPVAPEIPEIPDVAREVFRPEIVPPESELPTGHDEEFERLAYLRPRDTFVFVKQVPNASIDLRTEFRVIPAPRGSIRFTDDFRAVHQVPLDYALAIRVRLTIEVGSDHTYPFYPGDRVKSKETGAMGEVIRAKANGYLVRYEETDGDLWMPPTGIRLIDKDLTTRHYIRDAFDDGFVIKFGDVEEVRPTALLSMEFLKGANRPAFNRVSNMIAGEGLGRFPWIDRGILNFLIENDPRVWNREKADRMLSGQFEEVDNAGHPPAAKA
tara:strand:- start:2069 stop:3067 length:999 start_codon:yes stop_codon:yes gene_type:complete